jgi:hypothetical protein
MAERKPFLLRLDPETLAALQAWAADELRSTNGQVEFLLRRALRDAGRLPRKGEGQPRRTKAGGKAAPATGRGKDLGAG